MSRREDILALAAKALEDGRDPLDGAFLIDHSVKMDECYDLADDLALGAHLLLRLHIDLLMGGLVASNAGQRLAEALVTKSLHAD